jgi:uncharacterized protein (DUF924 family)
MAHQLNRKIFNPTLYKRILDVWFEGLPPDAKTATDTVIRRWFMGTPEEKKAFDAVCSKEFSHVLEDVGPERFPVSSSDSLSLATNSITVPLLEELDMTTNDLETTNRALSLILLFDQIPRNLYRTNETLPLVYNYYDNIALSLARHVLKMQPRPDLHPSVRHSPVRRLWFYLPFIHSENLSDHMVNDKICDDMRVEMAALGYEDCLKYLEKARNSAKHHREILEKFGRYPHRNACLRRTNSKEEEKWLNDGGETFGVRK